MSVIIPARNAAHYLEQTLPALAESQSDDHELIVVDDGSTDETAQMAEQFGAKVVRLLRQAGPSAARNAGVEVARGNVLVFLDADVQVHQDTLCLLLESLDSRPGIAAVFGSYDDDPADRHTVSSFKNLMHHYVHQQGSPDAATFWTGCGAIRREIFDAIGPFSPASLYCAEDIDYGHRLRDANHNIWLRRDIQCKHLKRWTLWNMVRTDVIQRGVPWTVMMLGRGKVDSDLNLNWRERGSAVLAMGILGALISEFAWDFGLILAITGLCFFLLLQRGFYKFLSSSRGWFFAMRCLPLHLLYYCYSIAAVVAGVALKHFKRIGPAHA